MPNEESMYRKNSDGSFSQFIELTGSKEQLVFTDHTQTGTILAGALQDITIFGVSGFMDDIIHLSLFVPEIVGATGTHSVLVYFKTPANSTVLLNYTFAATDSIFIDSGSVGGTPTSQTPSEKGAQVMVSKSKIDSLIPIIVRYVNNSNLSQTANRDCSSLRLRKAVF